MTFIFQKIILGLVLMGLASIPVVGSEPNYGGKYELADPKADRSLLLEVRQTGTRATIIFAAAMLDGSGSAPDGTGKGEVEDGILSFAFKDSFNNLGTCTLESKKDGYHLSMTVTKVVEPGPFHFYGKMVLKKLAKAAR